jgi:hypothetical protein
MRVPEERNQRPGSLFDDPPRYPGGPDLFVCGDCGIASDSTRTYPLLTIIFLFLFMRLQVDHPMKCPACMRRHVLIRLPPGILLANLLCPLVIVWWMVIFLRTFSSPRSS